MAEHAAGDEVGHGGGAGEDEERCDGIVKGGRHGERRTSQNKRRWGEGGCERLERKEVGSLARGLRSKPLVVDRVANEKMRDDGPHAVSLQAQPQSQSHLCYTAWPDRQTPS